MTSPSRKSALGFTLVEILLAVSIMLLIILLAVPSLGGALAQKRLDESFARFDELVRQAQKKSVLDGKPYEIVFAEDQVLLRPVGTEEVTQALEYDNKEGALELRLPFSSKPDNRWTFWGSGNCEPAEISYEGEEGVWKALYDPMTTFGEITESRTR